MCFCMGIYLCLCGVYMCLCEGISTWVQVPIEAQGAGVTGICYLMLVLGIALVFLGKAVFTLNHWAIFSAHTPRTFKTLLLKVFYPFPFLLPVLLTYTHLLSLKFIASFSLVPKCIKTTRSTCIYHFKTDHLVSENQLDLSPKEDCFSCS